MRNKTTEIVPDANKKLRNNDDVLYPDPCELKTVQELQNLLDESAKKHNGGFFQYTTLDKFCSMFNSKKLFLTQAKYFNDKLEACDIDDKTYICH